MFKDGDIIWKKNRFYRDFELSVGFYYDLFHASIQVKKNDADFNWNIHRFLSHSSNVRHILFIWRKKKQN